MNGLPQRTPEDAPDDDAQFLHPPQAVAGERLTPEAAQLRMLEAVLFAASEPLDEATLVERLPPDANVPALLGELEKTYAGRGVNLVRVAGRWVFRTAPDLSGLLQRNAVEQKRLSKAAMETLAIIAYHQPVTRAEIEDIRGVTMSKGTLDILLEIGWIRMRGRRRVPGRPVTYGTTDAFLMHFGLDKVSDLPGLEELRAAGLLEGRIPAAFIVPSPSDTLAQDEDPLLAGDEGETFEPDAAGPEEG
ncbi:MAG: SMC-Scp complex subunit ScpB [Alphaproteobacteria bacterium]|jgi:segregation and condensation protein B